MATELLWQGKILAVKGLGGYHLACDAQNEDAVKTLRKRKYREDKPFAVMAQDLETIGEYCLVSRAEEKLLKSYRAPIVLLKKKDGSNLATSVAPNNNYLGVMLAYTPLHHLILKAFKGLLVMTSGNISEEPIAYKNDEAQERLEKIADAFLINNRPIHIRCDDSVTRVFGGQEYILRRSRGYTPFPVILKKAARAPILAVGAHLKNTFCLLRNNQAFMSHHIGDLENTETMKSFAGGIEHIKNLFDIKPEAVAYDHHPRYLSTGYAKELDISTKIPVQHHHAHIASVMADNGFEGGEVIGIALDGVGYGIDGKLWGCEFMRADYRDFERLMHLEYMPLPGGEKAIKEPWRMAVAYLYRALGKKIFDLDIPLFKEIDRKKIGFLIHMMDHNINTHEISSAGRLFDAVSAIIGIRSVCNFEGQAAIEMEMIADPTADGVYPLEIEEGKPAIIKAGELVRAVVDDVSAGVEKPIIAGKFHNTMAELVLRGAEIISQKFGLNDVALSGGVFQNMILLEKCVNLLKRAGFGPLIHKRVPTNDGGISLGQAAVAAEVIRDKT